MTAIINDPTTERLERIALDQLHASPDNPRAVGDVAELAASITEHGVVEPLVVVPRAEGGYTVVAGHRRLAASALAGGIADAPCIVRCDLDDDQAAELRLVENLHRRDLSPLEEAAGYQVLVERGYSQRKLARQVGKSQPHISRRLSLLKLPAKAVDALDAGDITVEQATTLAGLEPGRVTELFKGGPPNEWGIRDAVQRPGRTRSGRRSAPPNRSGSTVAWYDDPDEGPRWVDDGEADAIEALDASRLHRLAPEDLPTETADDAESITGGCSITVEKPSRSKKWKWSCTCGESGTKTTEAYAREMGDLHLSEKHGLVAEEATS